MAPLFDCRGNGNELPNVGRRVLEFQTERLAKEGYWMSILGQDGAHVDP